MTWVERIASIASSMGCGVCIDESKGMKHVRLIEIISHPRAASIECIFRSPIVSGFDLEEVCRGLVEYLDREAER